MEVVWKRVPGYPLYECSSNGKVKNIKRQTLLKPTSDRRGYLKVILCKDNKHKNIAVHRIVATTFLENPHDFPQVNHKDGNKTNNCVENLEWCSPYYNIHHAINNGLITVKGEANPNAKLDRNTVGKIRDMFFTGKYNKSQLARMFCISHTMVRYIVERKSWSDTDEDL